MVLILLVGKRRYKMDYKLHMSNSCAPTGIKYDQLLLINH